MKIEKNEETAYQALKDCLDDIPFLQLTDVPLVDNNNRPDFCLKVLLQNRIMTIIVEYKSSGQPRLARETALQIKQMLDKDQGDYGVFTAPYISPEAAKICKDSGIGYLDLAGNCLISFDTIYVYREGRPNSNIQRRELRSLYSPKAERILRVLLGQPLYGWKTETLANAAQVSIGQVANVKKYLADREWLKLDSEGIRLKNPGALLDDWAAKYRFNRNKMLDYYTLSEMAECEYNLAEVCQNQGIRYALTAFSGAARLAPAVRYQRAMAYVDGDVNNLTNTLGWKPVTSGANVSLLVPYDEGVFFATREIDGTQLVAPLQIYLDLQNLRGRGEEAALSIRKVIEQSW
jgi:hypothetical protein